VFELRDRIYVLRVGALIRRLGLDGSVVFAGYVPEGEVRPWFELAEAAVLPYRRIEQSSVASLARSAGTPIVATDVGELAAFVQRPEWCVEPRSPARLAVALDSFLAAGVGRPAPAGGRDGAELTDAVRATLGVYAVREIAGT
jgi:glycosyltransferase involved in cell wall biosynthesis